MANKHTYPPSSRQRRTLLKLLAGGFIGSSLASAGCTHKKFFNASEDILLAGGNFSERGTEKNALIAVNLVQTEKRVIETPFLPHGILVNPANKYRIFCFEKNGSNACEVDLQSQNVINTFHPLQGQLFSGHASFTTDGTKIACVEFNSENRQGNITIRNANKFEINRQLPTLGLQPHDCHISRDNIITVSNTGTSESGFHQPSLVRISLDTDKLLERISLETSDLNCGHFEFSKDSDLVIASAPVNNTDRTLGGAVSLRTGNEAVHTMIEPEAVIQRMTGEALDIEIIALQSAGRTIAAVTHPEANLLTFWSIKDKKIIKAFAIENPRGLSQTIDKQSFILSYGNRPAMVKISATDLSPQPDSIVQPTLASGEHIINWSKTIHRIMPARIYD